jgi:hypothetical protein
LTFQGGDEILPSDIKMAPREVRSSPGPGPQPTTIQEVTVDTTSVPQHHRDDHDHDQRPCACWDGWVWLGIAVEDPDIADGEDVVYERVPCRRCASR